MSKNLHLPTKLTEFAPLQQEEKPQSVGQFISKFFKISRGDDSSSSDCNFASHETTPTLANDVHATNQNSNPNIYPVDLNEGRSLPNVLKRISNLLALKTNNLQDYEDTELKQYWMPDSVSKECYECSEKFTTFRRRHHCRVCGQIFCSQCCNQQIPGKIFGCTGDLRVCTYCCKVVLSYLQSSSFDASLYADLKCLQENLQTKFGDQPCNLLSNDVSQASKAKLLESTETLRRKISVGYQEEKFASGSSVQYLTNEEKCKALQNSVSLRNLFEEIFKPVTGITFTPYKHRLRIYQDCFFGSELVDWLICQQKAKTRIQAAAICQALLEGGYIETFGEPGIFVDGYFRYRKGISFVHDLIQVTPDFQTSTQEEPSWVQQIPHELSNTDSENEQTPPTLAGISTSSSYMLDLNVEANTVYLSRPPELIYSASGQEYEKTQSFEHDVTVVRPSEQRELAPESGWYNVSTLREENGEREAYNLLTEAYKQHEQSLLRQLLLNEGLASSWEVILRPLIHDLVSLIRPDKNHDAIELDIRNYVQFKKLPGELKKDTFLVNGIVCSKNVVHKEMYTDIENPKILLLECSIMYQRTEGRLMSLEPVIMQEHEYLRHVVARIVALQPDVVLVHRNISRLAQDMLRQHKITLVHNVKQTIIERLSRCTNADIVTAVDAHIGRPKLGTCKRFYLKSFVSDSGSFKTLMFFEGLPQPWLGATVLLRGGSKQELASVKNLASFFLFSAYNWRLEKSFLMDEFALPPTSKTEFLDETGDTSDYLEKPKDSKGHSINEKKTEHEQRHSVKVSDPSQSIEAKKMTVESINDFTDPLHSYDATKKSDDSHEALTVAKLPFSNNFKKHLDDTILCVSPYIIFPVPYLETDQGTKCKLRRFFFKELYRSEQFKHNAKVKRRHLDNKLCNTGLKITDVKPLHPFLTTKVMNIENAKVQNMLANFRACGGSLIKNEKFEIAHLKAADEGKIENADRNKLDVFDPANHQKLAVLFCSFSHDSNNAPAFCVNPWIVYMDFYGRNDIPIGCFLERYCFRGSYACPSKACVTPMVKHIRRFVHNSGCVTIALNNFESEFAEDNIVMWSWCTKCQSVSPVVPMSADTWSYSFAKYLESRFYGDVFTRRGQSLCQHSLHHDHFQYFGYKNYVASFKFTSINIWEISLPPTVIEISYDVRKLKNLLIDEEIILAQKGHDLLAVIQDKLSIVLVDETDTLATYKQLLNKDQTQFKQKVEEIQLQLTSSTIEKRGIDDNIGISSYWKVQDNLTKIRITLADLVESWNSNLTEIIKGCDKRKEKIAPVDLESSTVECAEVKNTSYKDGSDKVENIEENSARPQSEDLTVICNDDAADNKKELTRKPEKSVKHILDKLLSSPGQNNLIQAPFSPQEHYTLPIGVYGPVIVYESEVSSIVAYALNSFEYKKCLEELTKKPQSTDQSASPATKRKNNEKEKAENDEKTGLLGFLRNKESKTDLNCPCPANGGDVFEVDHSTTPPEKVDDTKKIKNSQIEIQFQDSTCNFFCRIYLADKFAALRAAVLPIGEEAFVRSLCRSVQWKARGGKSGSNFAKTLDNRFILKDMSKTEIQLFLESAANYFTYMHKCYTTMQPTLLGKIVGIYQISYKNNSNNVTHRSHLLVMENLFYNREVTQKFDLKGSMRNRLVIPDNSEGEIVLLDENLLKMTCDSPLYILPHSKEVLLAAIQKDTQFLSTQCVMDYSLLVGLDSENKELVLGIIDYIRTFTWDKRLETMVKRSGFLGGQGKLPTIVSPEEYQKRFIEAMHKYFLEVPDHYAGLGKGLEI